VNPSEQPTRKLPPTALQRLKEVARGESELPPTSPTAEGRTFGRYRLQAELGRGGGGVVYRALDTQLDRIVALKILANPGNDEVRARFLREAKTIAQLKHPNIVGVYDVGEAEGQLYLTMELIEGSSLDRRLSDLSRERRLRILIDVARAVHHAHEHGIVHRDLKPGNILLSRDGRPVVADFGLARNLDPAARVTETGTALGTPCYMSPEATLGLAGALDTRSDIFSLGVILYECVTGRLPFRGNVLFDILRSIVEDHPATPHGIDPSIDADLEAIISKSMEKEKTHRYERADLLAADLEAWLMGGPVSARRGGFGRWLRRRRRSLAYAGIAVIATAVIALGAWKAFDRSRPPEIPSFAYPEPSRKDPAEAERLTTEAEKLLQTAAALRQQGKREEAKKLIEEAGNKLRRSLEHSDRLGRTYVTLARCHSLRNDYSAALQTFVSMREKGADSGQLDWAVMAEARARIFLMVTETLPAPDFFDLTRLAAQDGFPSFLRLLESKASGKMGQRREALRGALERAASGRLSEAHAAAKILRALETDQEPIEQLGEILLGLLARKKEDRPEGERPNLVSQIVAALWHVQDANFAAARQLLSFVDPPTPSVRYLFAHIELSQDNVKEAEKYLDQAAAPSDQQYALEYLRGLCFLNRKDAGGGEAKFRAVARTHPEIAAVRYHLAVALAMKGAKAEAVGELRDLVTRVSLSEFGSRIHSLAARTLLRFRLTREVLRTDPWLESLRGDREFQALLRK